MYVTYFAHYSLFCIGFAEISDEEDQSSGENQREEHNTSEDETAGM